MNERLQDIINRPAVQITEQRGVRAGAIVTNERVFPPGLSTFFFSFGKVPNYIRAIRVASVKMGDGTLKTQASEAPTLPLNIQWKDRNN